MWLTQRHAAQEARRVRAEARRAGWWHAGVRDPESVAEHPARVAQPAALLAAEEGGNPERAACLALWHDTQETRTGDLPHTVKPYLTKPDPEHITEDQTAVLPDTSRDSVRHAVGEYEAADTLEARCARVERFIPQAQLLPQCDLVVSHGGSGSVIGALAHGPPSVLLPMGVDQPQRPAECGPWHRTDSGSGHCHLRGGARGRASGAGGPALPPRRPAYASGDQRSTGTGAHRPPARAAPLIELVPQVGNRDPSHRTHPAHDRGAGGRSGHPHGARQMSRTVGPCENFRRPSTRRAWRARTECGEPSASTVDVSGRRRSAVQRGPVRCGGIRGPPYSVGRSILLSEAPTKRRCTRPERRQTRLSDLRRRG